MANTVLAAGRGQNTVFASAARTATPDTVEFELPARVASLTLFVDCTAVGVTPSVVFNLLGVDRLSGKTWLIIASTAVVAISTRILKVSAGLAVAANVSVNDVPPPVVRVEAVHGNGVSATYSAALHVA